MGSAPEAGVSPSGVVAGLALPLRIALIGLRRGFKNAMGLAGTQRVARSGVGTLSKPMSPGFAAMGRVLATAGQKAGHASYPAVLDGDRGTRRLRVKTLEGADESPVVDGSS